MFVGNVSSVFFWFFVLVSAGLVLGTGAMIALGLCIAGIPWRKAIMIGLAVPTAGTLAAWTVLLVQERPEASSIPVEIAVPPQ